MPTFIDITGQKFGRLTVIERAINDKYNNTRWLCQCGCGKEKIIRSTSLRNKITKSCGCIHDNCPITHSHSYTRTYKTWQHMVQRCYNPNDSAYKNYGGRGIKVCETWLKFEGFLQDMGERPPDMSLDRVDNNGDYCKENCRWANAKEQNRNRGEYNKLITINGITKCLAEWCEIYHINFQKAWYRLNNKWTPEEALELTARNNNE